MLIKFKFCPKCHGDLYLTEDIFGKYVSCLQCGFLKDLPEERPEERELVHAGGPGPSSEAA